MLLSIALKLFFGVMTTLALVPTSTKTLHTSTSHPATSYAEALSRYHAVVAAETARVEATGQSILLTHGKRTGQVFVLMHGLTNSPRQFRRFGEMLYERGYNVYIPRLPFHAFRELNVSALGALTAECYLSFADSAIDLADGLGDTITVIGLSGGGTAAVWVGQHRPDVQRIMAIAPAFGIKDIPPFLRTPATNLFVRLPNIDFTLGQPGDTARYVYRGISTRSVAQTLRLGRALENEASRQAPFARSLILVTNAHDPTVTNSDVDALAKRWRRHGAAVMEFRFDPSLRLPHDVIDVKEPVGDPYLVYDVLLDLLTDPFSANAVPATNGVRP